ncbi:Hypothetical_protein [Hexamita inflata]|uniref:Hypothetical_protein n=1 Tax=Hexamita inflata TaxID=28002 RepID=A0AA86RIF4_9EUKA|nr:Hypothetical protein HINF_LOCUS62998 [Hexamita inflata]
MSIYNTNICKTKYQLQTQRYTGQGFERNILETDEMTNEITVHTITYTLLFFLPKSSKIHIKFFGSRFTVDGYNTYHFRFGINQTIEDTKLMQLHLEDAKKATYVFNQ